MKRTSVLIKVETYPRLQNHLLPRDSLVVVNEWLLLNNLEKEAAREEIVSFVTQKDIGQSRKTWWEVVVVVPKVSVLEGGSSVECCRGSLNRKCTSSDRGISHFWVQFTGLYFFLIIFLIGYLEVSCDEPQAPSLPSPPRSTLQKDEEQKKSNLCCPYIHWSMIKLLVASSLKKTEPSPRRTPSEAIMYGELYFIILITIFKNSLWWLSVCCYFLEGRVEKGDLGVVIEFFHVSLSYYFFSHQYQGIPSKLSRSIHWSLRSLPQSWFIHAYAYIEEEYLYTLYPFLELESIN